MGTKLPVEYEIGFADSEIMHYSVNSDDLILTLECWNAVILEIKFIGFASVFGMNLCTVSEFFEIFNSPLLDNVLKEYYNEIPKEHNYRIFKFLNPNDMTILEIVCEGIEIKKISN